MNTRQTIAEQLGQLFIANLEQAETIERLQKELAQYKQKEAVISGYECDQEGQGQPTQI